MQTNQSNNSESENKAAPHVGGYSSRQFLKLAGAAILASTALPQATRASNHTGGVNFIYEVGVVFNPDLPGLSGELILNVYLAVAENGTGLGTLSDPVHPTVNSHLIVQKTRRHGNELGFVGVILRSNDPARVGQPFAVTSYVQGDFTSLVLQLNGETFDGQGFHVDSMKVIVD